MSREPLTDTEQQAWQNLVALTVHLSSTMDRRLSNEPGISHFDYRVLATLAEQPGQVLQLVDLGRRTQSSLSRLSHALDSLTRRGLIRRFKSPPGQRGIFAALTDAGRSMHERAMPTFMDAARGLVFDVLDAEQVRELLALTAPLVPDLSGKEQL